MGYLYQGRLGKDVNTRISAPFPTAYHGMPGERPGHKLPEPGGSVPRHEPLYWSRDKRDIKFSVKR